MPRDRRALVRHIAPEGVSEGAAEFRCRLDAFVGVVEKREAALLAFHGEPRTLEEIIEYRLVYRPRIEGPHVSAGSVAVWGDVADALTTVQISGGSRLCYRHAAHELRDAYSARIPQRRGQAS